MTARHSLFKYTGCDWDDEGSVEGMSVGDGRATPTSEKRNIMK